jgi:hypothetical protein
MVNLGEILNFLSANKYLLLIFIVAGFIVHFWGIFYIMAHRKEDFSYSGHTYVWYEGSPFWLFLARISWICGGFVPLVSFYYFIKG